MKIVIAPDSFKGSLSAKQVATCIQQGLKISFPKANYKLIPMADGGEGTMQALVDATNGKIFFKKVKNPLGLLTKAQFGILGDQKTAVIEMAQASGLQYVNSETANPLITSTYGTGELIKAALDKNVKRIIVGLGGSATNDGGAGMAQALGAKLLDLAGNELKAGGGNLNDLDCINIKDLDPRLKNTEIILASDVTNPLTGPNGASQIFGPQKGATPEMVKTLDSNLRHFANIIKRDLGTDYENYSGAGAAGGLGFGLLSFTHAKLRAGVEVVLATNKFKEKVKGADIVFTGEGGTDYQTQFGKTPFGVAKAAKEIVPNVPVVILTGNIGKGINSLYKSGKIDAIFSTESGAKDLATAIKDSKHDLTQTAENIGRLMKSLNIYNN